MFTRNRTDYCFDTYTTLKARICFLLSKSYIVYRKSYTGRQKLERFKIKMCETERPRRRAATYCRI